MAGKGKGVRLATGYVEITAETSQVPEAIKDALNQAGKQAKPAGKAIGKDIEAGLRDGLNTKGFGAQVGKDLQASIDAGTAGKKIGTAVAVGITAGVKAGIPGMKEATQAVTQEAAGGVSGVFKDLGKMAADELKAGAKDWAKGIVNEVASGQVQKALDDVGGTIKSNTDLIYNLGTSVGIHLDAVKGFGEHAATWLDNVGAKAGDISNKLSGAATGIKKMHEGGAANKIQGLADATGNLNEAAKGLGANLGGVPEKIISMAGAAGGIAALADSFAGLGASLGILASPAALGVLGILAAPLAAGSFAWWMMQPGQNPRNWQIAPQLGPPITQTPAGQMALPGQTPAAQIPDNAPPGTQYTATPGDISNPFGALLPPGWTLQNGQLVPPGGSPVPAQGGAGTGVVPPTSVAPSSSTTPNGQGLLPVTATVRDSMNAAFPGHTIGGYRADPGYPNEHPAGKALDFMVGGVAEGYKYLSTALAQPGVKYVIFDHKMWYPDGRSEPYTGPNPHTDHLHIHTEPGAPQPKPPPPAPAQAAQGPTMPGSQLDMPDAQAFDDGIGVLPPGISMAVNNTGQPETLISPDLLKNAGPSQDQLKAAGLPPSGPPPPSGAPSPSGPPLAPAPPGGQQAANGLESARTAGFIPTGAGSTSVAGTSMVAGLLNLGNEAVAGLIDTGASAAQMGITAGTMGMAAAAGPATSVGIQLVANEAKRAVSWGFQMGAIGADALIEQAFGMVGGAPRWIGYDYTQFMPHMDFGAIGKLGVTTGEKALQQGQGGPGQAPGGPVEASHLPGSQPVGPPVPKFGGAPKPLSMPGPAPGEGDMKTAGPGPGAAPGPAAPPPPPASPSPAPSAPGPLDQLIPGALGLDEGGWWPSNTYGLNTSGRPELVLSGAQLDAAAPTSGSRGRANGGDTYHITAVDAFDVARQIDKRKSLAAMRYSGRP